MKSIDTAELNNKRLLVFIESDKFPNEYHQVIFSKEHFKKVSDVVSEGLIKSTEGMRDGFEQIEMQVSEKMYRLPDEFSDFA